jgi:holin-like protein
MLSSFATLLIFQCLGEGVIFALGLPIPGPVVGMLMLFVALVASPRLLAHIEETGAELLRHLSLLFVPAGVGIVVAAASIRGQWLGVIVSIIGSTVLTLGGTALVTGFLLRRQASEKPPESPDA